MRLADASCNGKARSSAGASSHTHSRFMLMTGPQHSRPAPLLPLSIQLRMLKPARISRPTTPAMSRISSLSNVAAHDGPEGEEVEQRPSAVQFENIEEWMQLLPQ